MKDSSDSRRVHIMRLISAAPTLRDKMSDPNSNSPFDTEYDKSVKDENIDSGCGRRDGASGSKTGGLVYGYVSMMGRRRVMEDVVTVAPPGWLAGEYSLFAVYDGHGGAKVAEVCGEKMHKCLEKHIERAKNLEENDFDWKKVMVECFCSMDEELEKDVTSEDEVVNKSVTENSEDEVVNKGSSMNNEDEVVNYTTDNSEYESVNKTSSDNSENEAVNKASTENSEDEVVNKAWTEKMIGSTAVLVVVGKEEVVVANCGDSRAVLYRGGVSMPLSKDHKPERADEKERIEAAGGKILSWNGWRVQGVLATSRSLGDHYLKPYVTSEREVTVIKRTDSDDFLIIGTDGLFDVISNEIACEVVRKSLRGKKHDAREESVSEAATILAELAMAKGSKDNISVIVVHMG